MIAGIHAVMVADSISPARARLSTLAVRMPKSLVAQFNTHRAFSRNSASARAIPVARVIAMIEGDTFIPRLTVAGKGMASNATVEADEQFEWAKDVTILRNHAIDFARRWAERGHKQHVNRYLEPWMYSTVLVSSTEWANFLDQRDHPEAQPEMQEVAAALRSALAHSIPVEIGPGGWHLPFILQADRDALALPDLIRVSVGRCARVSYLTHDRRRDPAEDAALYRRMRGATPPHWSPLEHVAVPAVCASTRSGNFEGWHQLRHLPIPLDWLDRPDGD